jgi:VWFA-related protein
MRSQRRVLIVAICCFSFPGLTVQTPAQQGAPPVQLPPPTDVHTAPAPSPDRRVSLDVVVTDKSGHAVAGLQQQDFTLLDDKRTQPILSFQAFDQTSKDGTSKADDPPMQAILLIDGVNTSFSALSTQRTQLDKFLRQDGGKLSMPMSLFFLADTSSQSQSAPTRDGNVLADALNSNPVGLRLFGRNSGYYAGEERVQTSLRALEGMASFEVTQPGRKLLIWLSPGWPLLSGPGVQLSDKNQESIFNLVVELSAALRQARVTLYSIDPLGMSDAGAGITYDYKAYLKGVPSASKTQAGNLALQVFATQTGGQVLNSSNDITASVVNCLGDAKAFYTISFDSPPADHPNEYHSLQVKLDKPGLTARTRTGYYAQK